MKAFLITVVWITGWTMLVSCAAEYQSPRTGIKYQFNVPLEAFGIYVPKDFIHVSPAK